MKIYVGNLPYRITDNDLKAAFSEFGTVLSANIVSDRETKRSRGFGFVEMENDSEANEAIETMNGGELDGRKLVVNPAKAR